MLNFFSADFLLQLAGITVHAQCPGPDDLAPYPPAETGAIRKVIRLPRHPQESELKVEILTSITTFSDNELDCNGHWRNGRFEARHIPGSPHTYYYLRPGWGTRRGCERPRQQEDNVVLEGENFMLDYDSKQPLVIYVPDDTHFATLKEKFDIRLKYRVWASSRLIELNEATTE